MGQEPRAWDTLVDDLRRYRRLDESLAAAANPFTANVSFDREGTGLVVQALAHFLTDALKLAAAGTEGAIGFVRNLPARQVRRQRGSTRNLLRARRLIGLEGIELLLDRLQVCIDRLVK